MTRTGETGRGETARPPEPTAKVTTTFPEGFLFGVATSAYQIEGSPLADGAGASIWHRFAHSPGRVHLDQTGDVACDHYRRFREDVRLMHDLGVDAYRFSLSWSRILPRGVGEPNAAGLDFYSRLVDALLEHGIMPCVTLYHWDLPADLDDRGGWLNRDVAHWFGEYARVAFRALGDRVPIWFTINEPWVVADAGYLFGTHAPGHRNLFEAAISACNLLRAHGTAVRVHRAEGRGHVGLVVNLEPKYPASDTAPDHAAVERANAYMNQQYLDPVLLGRHPEALPGVFGAAWTALSAADFAIVREPIDFLGINYYTRSVVRDDSAVLPVRASGVPQRSAVITETGWEVHPESLTRVLLWVKERYGDIPLYITENGAAFPDPPHVDGEVLDDPLRIDYLRRHLLAARDALDRGVDLRGYFVWSLLDNYEWSCGYSKRFGIVHVDFETQRRTLKESARYYRSAIATRGTSLG